MTIADSERFAGPPPVTPRSWRHPSILAATLFAVFSGFAQFGVSTSLADIAAELGEPDTGGGTGLLAQVGLSGTTLGIGLAAIRLASLGNLPLAGLADRAGRRRVLFGCSTAGLALTAAAAGSPTFFWFVLLVAAARPLLAATNTLAGLIAAEDTTTADRSKAVALVTAGYGIGAGLTALLRDLVDASAGFRGVFLMALVPLVAVPVVVRGVLEPVRFDRLRDAAARGTARLGVPVLGALRRDARGRLLLLAFLWFSFAAVTGPGNTFVFLYTEGVLGLSPTVTTVMVLWAGPGGLAGLLLGRFLADRVGRRVTAAAAQLSVAGALALTYSGSAPAAIFGYGVSMLAAAAYSPATGSLAVEMFPTSVRGSVAGWLGVAGVLGAVTGLAVFGLLADAFGGFTVPALVIAVPAALVGVAFAGLPETHGRELEESAPEPAV